MSDKKVKNEQKLNNQIKISAEYRDGYPVDEYGYVTFNSSESVTAKAGKKTRLTKLNPDTTPSYLRRKMTDSELIKSWIDSGECVLLRGPSGIGKTERIKTMYPNLVYIKLTNNMFPEKVVGSMNLQTGENIPPAYAKDLLLKYATNEEKSKIKDDITYLYSVADEIYNRSKNADEKCVILLDELLNVKPAVQSLVYTLVLNKVVETGTGLKLPANTVVVATGNQKRFSSVAQDLAEPLEKRFDHILDMEPKVNEWIYEYAIPNKIHPSVVGFMLSNLYSATSGIDYFYEEPEVGQENLDKNGCAGRTNDPRSWVAISKSLYNFEQNLQDGKYDGKNVMDLLTTTINTKLREEWANDFINYYLTPTLTVEDVVNANYEDFDLPGDIFDQFSTMTNLLAASIEEMPVVRNFIEKNCSSEVLAVFDACWPSQDEEKSQALLDYKEELKLEKQLRAEEKITSLIDDKEKTPFEKLVEVVDPILLEDMTDEELCSGVDIDDEPEDSDDDKEKTSFEKLVEVIDPILPEDSDKEVIDADDYDYQCNDLPF